jgi:hypothetical protein
MFLLRQNKPWAWAGWLDDFNRFPEDPIRQPWGQWGTNSPGKLNALNELELPPASGTNLGGVSYEFQPFTPNYGIEFNVWWPVIGAGESALSLFIMEHWARVGVNWNNTLGVRLFHQPVGSGDTIRIQQWANLNSLSNDVSVGSSPVAFNGNDLTLRVWVDDDRFIRAWMNDVLVAWGTLLPQYDTSLLRRGVNLMNQAAVPAYFRWVKVYDRPSSFPTSGHWVQNFSDDFNRTNGAPGNGWTVLGSAGQIVNNSYSTTGTDDGGRAIIRDGSNSTGRVRVEATVGGNIGPSTSADSALILCSNSDGTQGLAANIFGNQLVLSRWSGSVTGPTWTVLTSQSVGVTVASGDVVAFSIYNGVGWLELNGVRRLYFHDINSVVPITNTWFGLRVERISFSNSNSWNDVRFFAGL